MWVTKLLLVGSNGCSSVGKLHEAEPQPGRCGREMQAMLMPQLVDWDQTQRHYSRARGDVLWQKPDTDKSKRLLPLLI